MKWEWTTHGHAVALDVNYLTGSKQLVVDGKPVATKQKLTGWSHAFTLDGKPATVRVAIKHAINPDAFLDVAGASIAPTNAPRAVPIWIWLFVLANVAILIVARGGMLPGAIAGCGAVGAVAASRSRWTLPVRLAAAAASTGAAWLTWFLVVRVLTS